MDKNRREAYAIIELARKAVRKQGTFKTSNAEFHAICALLHAGDYLRLGKPLTAGSHTARFFELEAAC